MSLRQVLAATVMAAAVWSATGDARGGPGAHVSTAQRYSRETGAVAGTVLFPGTPSLPAILSVYKEQAFCGSSVPDPSLLVAPDGGLKNVVVTLRGPGLDQPADHPRPSSSTTSAAGSRPTYRRPGSAAPCCS